MLHEITFLATLAVLWLIPILLVARFAGGRGYRFSVPLALALAISWPLVLLVVLVRPGRSGQNLDEPQR